jgi:fused signal recognition particle receptor
MGIFSRISSGLRKTSHALSSGISGLFGTNTDRADLLESLEDMLIMADMGASIAADMTALLDKKLPGSALNEAAVKTVLADEIIARFAPNMRALEIEKHQPCVMMMVGVNGNGKTTSLGKLAQHFKRDGKRVMLIAADTFRAAAVAQLAQWAKRADVCFVQADQGSDPAAVVYRGLTQAKQEGFDLVLIDTAGRLHNKQNLMDELQKMIQVAGKIIPDAPHHILQVIDATTGQNAVAQLQAFSEQSGVNGLVITKLDGTAKAGIAVALNDQFELPIYYIGVGEGIDDLLAFDARAYANSLLQLDAA